MCRTAKQTRRPMTPFGTASDLMPIPHKRPNRQRALYRSIKSRGNAPAATKRVSPLHGPELDIGAASVFRNPFSLLTNCGFSWTSVSTGWCTSLRTRTTKSPGGSKPRGPPKGIRSPQIASPKRLATHLPSPASNGPGLFSQAVTPGQTRNRNAASKPDRQALGPRC